jgi:2-keto-4-pentenoate hydratase/2-oxohepta-3-ene-1,7-dioic acid hydratase in catechol pathway
MRVVSFERAGRPGIGIVTDSGVIDASRHLSGRFENLREILLANGLEQLRSIAQQKPDFSAAAIRYRPLIDDPATKFLCVGINYMPHIKEMGRERPEHPVIFVRFASSLVGHGEPMVKPRVSEQFDFEGELAVIIGKPARHVPRARAYEYVAGYSCFNDGSVRDYQRHGPQWTPGKNFVASGAFGPWLVTADEAPNAARSRLQTLLNEQIVQDESTAELCFDIPALIEYCSTWTELLPGDVIATGTPGGVGAGRKPPLWMKAGDTVTVEISGIGTLRNPIRDENAG